ncbi:ribonuclease HII [Halodesulfurarchaeum formicicum]|uniref:Ribonuclease HII n=1 Tax=Halodesulfurarchaeum formicicum TaxID=1873524 RepID=A0A1J1A928_9EURY|nr:ribonuclease HII [Halodesulfurarchaeum formicicum]APE94618.1 ribonuclease HII [Halodesulfurarchaeum formicicum]
MPFGVDEAGKGPVLGSMFAAAVVADPEDLPDGIADSKTLTPQRRERLAATLRAAEAISIGVAEIPVARIDDPETDMNTLTVSAQAQAIDATGVSGETGYVDAGDVDAERFGRRVEKRVDTDVRIQAEHGADETYPLVGAASVIAKVSRDTHVAALRAEYGTDLGSGYPSDERTRSFLEAYVKRTGELPDCARRSWQTSSDILSAATQTGLEDFD